jgi:hypothetical protein
VWLVTWTARIFVFLRARELYMQLELVCAPVKFVCYIIKTGNLVGLARIGAWV